jgi:hypothetical protein
VMHFSSNLILHDSQAVVVQTSFSPTRLTTPIIGTQAIDSASYPPVHTFHPKFHIHSYPPSLPVESTPFPSSQILSSPLNQTNTHLGPTPPHHRAIRNPRIQRRQNFQYLLFLIYARYVYKAHHTRVPNRFLRFAERGVHNGEDTMEHLGRRASFVVD